MKKTSLTSLSLATLLLMTGLGISQADAQSAAPVVRATCPEGRLADGKTCIPPKMAETARNKAIMLANARISYTGPAQPPSRDADALNRELALRLFFFNVRHAVFGR